mmetsp:Transcript_55420/g.108487  ORF Transcript_55420/g.108487 Transcript_55420/m.108487 type:complete len:205 (-) Transcript_55420:20-634(-)
MMQGIFPLPHSRSAAWLRRVPADQSTIGPRGSRHRPSSFHSSACCGTSGQNSYATTPQSKVHERRRIDHTGSCQMRGVENKGDSPCRASKGSRHPSCTSYFCRKVHPPLHDPLIVRIFAQMAFPTVVSPVTLAWLGSCPSSLTNSHREDHCRPENLSEERRKERTPQRKRRRLWYGAGQDRVQVSDRLQGEAFSSTAGNKCHRS